MKLLRIVPVILLTLILVSTSVAKFRIPENPHEYKRNTYFGFGGMWPASAELDWVLHFEYNWRLDNSVFHGPGFMFYSHNFVEQGEVWNLVQPGWEESTYTTEFESRLTLFSPQYWLGVEFEGLGVKNLTQFVKISLGMDMLWAREENFTEDASNKDLYFGLSWNATAGTKLTLGERTQLVTEVGYHHGKPSRKKEQIANLPTRTEINMSGMMIKIGINYFFWKQ